MLMSQYCAYMTFDPVKGALTLTALTLDKLEIDWSCKQDTALNVLKAVNSNYHVLLVDNSTLLLLGYNST